MDIGTEKPAIIVEPVEDPFRKTAPAEPAPAPTETPEPVRVGSATDGAGS